MPPWQARTAKRNLILFCLSACRETIKSLYPQRLYLYQSFLLASAPMNMIPKLNILTPIKPVNLVAAKINSDRLTSTSRNIISHISEITVKSFPPEVTIAIQGNLIQSNSGYCTILISIIGNGCFERQLSRMTSNVKWFAHFKMRSCITDTGKCQDCKQVKRFIIQI